MNIQINGTNDVNSVLKDLELFTDQSDWDLPDWLLAIKNKEVAFFPKVLCRQDQPRMAQCRKWRGFIPEH